MYKLPLKATCAGEEGGRAGRSAWLLANYAGPGAGNHAYAALHGRAIRVPGHSQGVQHRRSRSPHQGAPANSLADKFPCSQTTGNKRISSGSKSRHRVEPSLQRRMNCLLLAAKNSMTLLGTAGLTEGFV